MPVKVSKEARHELVYKPPPTIRMFHASGAQIRCIVGPIGSGKTSAAAWEIFYYIPMFLWERYGIKRTRWVIIRNTYRELADTTRRTVFEWFPFGIYHRGDDIFEVNYPDKDITVEALFRSCDRPEHIKKFKSLEITGYWVDESIEVSMEIKKMLKQRIGRFPRLSPVRFGIETTNPPEVDDPTYKIFKWMTPVPGPTPEGEPLKDHEGFWQPPGENEENLRPGYYDQLREDYRDSPDWIARYIEGKPGVMQQGKTVYHNFSYDEHVTDLEWAGGPLFIGLDHSGNLPAAVVVEALTERRAHILMEFWTEKYGIVDFGRMLMSEIRSRFPEAVIAAVWGDPAGDQRYSKRGGGFTSNSELLREECGINVQPSEQNLTARIESVEQMLARRGAVKIDRSCRRLISGFVGGYVYPEYADGRIGEKPVKNRFSHVHEALQYVFVKLYGTRAINRLTPEKARMYEEIDLKNSRYDPLDWGLG